MNNHYKQNKVKLKVNVVTWDKVREEVAGIRLVLGALKKRAELSWNHRKWQEGRGRSQPLPVRQAGPKGSG